MDGGTLAAIITAAGALAVAVVGYVLNRRMGLPSKVQQTIREEQQLYETALEDKVKRLERELLEEKSARETDKRACNERLDRMGDDLVDRNLLIDRLQDRVRALEKKVAAA